MLPSRVLAGPAILAMNVLRSDFLLAKFTSSQAMNVLRSDFLLAKFTSSQKRWALSSIHKKMFLMALCKRFHQKIARIGQDSQKMVLTREDCSFPVCQNSVLKEVEQVLGSALDSRPQAPVPKSSILVISGPSGVGKDAVINRLKEVRKDIHFVVTATTRPKRPGEVDGKDYYFVSKEEFESMLHKDELLEHAIVYGDYKGIPRKQVRQCIQEGRDAILRVDVQGAATIRSVVGSGAIFIFLVAESEVALVKRLIDRKTETMEKLLLRIATAKDEMKRMDEFDYVVVNADGQLEKSVSLICSIIDAEKARVNQRVVLL